MAPYGGSWHHLLTPETQCPAVGLAAFLEGAQCLHVQGHSLGRKDREGRESKGAERGKLLSPAGEDLGEIPPSLQAPISSPLKLNMLNEGKDCFAVGCSVPGIFQALSHLLPQTNPGKKEEPGFRVVRRLGQGHTAIQYKSQNSNSWTSKSRV